MADGERSVGEAAMENVVPETPATPVGVPQGILIGEGGDPQMLGLPIFIIGSLALGFALVGVVPAATSLGTIIPEIAAATAFGQFVATRWAIGLGQSIVACIFGIFTGFWGSLTVFLLGLFHGWLAIPPTEIVHAELLFYISWDILIFFLFILTLRLPAVYPAIIGFIVVAVTLVVLGLEYPGSLSTFFHLAGIAVFVFCGFGLWTWMHVGSVALGGPPQPSLGPPIIK